VRAIRCALFGPRGFDKGFAEKKEWAEGSVSALTINCAKSLDFGITAMQDMVTSKNPAISFPVGYHDLHPNISINFQLNRFYGWVGDDSMLTEMREVNVGVNDYPTFTKIILGLGENALARYELLKGAYYLRLAEFFLSTGDSTVTSRNGCPPRCSSATPATTPSCSKVPARGRRSNWRT
jgi:hypothetical protein